MRVTMQSLYRNILVNLNRNNESLNRINGQISSGKLMSKISDDPVSLVNALGLRTNLSELGQYQKNLKYGTTVINGSENALTQMKELTMRAKTLAIQQANAPMTAENRANAASEVKHLWEQAVILANSSVNGKFVFGGYRTTGYTEAEPAPFVQGARDGYFVNGDEPDRIAGKLTGTVGSAQDLAAADFLVNGTDIGAVVLTGGLTQGLNMGGANNLKTAINTQSGTTGASASLTTLTYSAAATGAATGDGSISFYLNGAFVGAAVTTGDAAAVTNASLLAAINAKSELTGVEAEIGDGTNGAAADTLILKNVTAGDESAIEIASFSNTAAGTAVSLANGSQAVDATHSTGEISLTGTSAFTITTSAADDTILALVGLGGGDKGFADEAADGELRYGPALVTADFLINGTGVTTSADSISTIYADASAAAKAAAINNGDYGVTATVIPASWAAQGAVEAGTETSKLTATIANDNQIDAGDLAINGIATTSDIPINVGTDPHFGYNMERATTVKDVVNSMSATTGVTATLTTLTAGAAVDYTAGTATIEFTLNGETVKFNASGTNNVAVAFQAVDAINAISDLTGVTAARGDDNNGGTTDSIVLRNILSGDETPIVLAGLAAAETARIGLSDGTFTVAAANTGQVSFSSDDQFTLSSPNNLNDDNILKELGLNGGEDDTGISGDVEDDGKLTYGSTPVYLASGDLVINGVDIFAKTAAITDKDGSNALVQAINARQDDTGVVASRDNAGRLLLTALDGRNLHLQTSALGEKVTHLNGGTPAPNDRVYFGAISLFSDQPFKLESDIATTPGGDLESGFDSLGLAGGAATTGESDDVAGDGVIQVTTIHHDSDYVRYAGDRDNDISFKVGRQSTIEVSKNGYDAVFDTGVFSVLKAFEDILKGDNFRTATGAAQATDTSATLASGDTGLEQADQVISGSFKVAITDHGRVPATTTTETEISINPANDTLEDIAQRLNGIPGLKASWTDDGYLKVESRDAERYSFALTDDDSNFLNAAGIEVDNQQVSGISKAIADLDGLLESLTDQVSDFGARANRIEVQTNIYLNLEISTSENLSELEDTDLVKAIMELQAKEVAYQASLNAAAKTMKMSLLDYL